MLQLTPSSISAIILKADSNIFSCEPLRADGQMHVGCLMTHLISLICKLPPLKIIAFELALTHVKLFVRVIAGQIIHTSKLPNVDIVMKQSAFICGLSLSQKIAFCYLSKSLKESFYFYIEQYCHHMYSPHVFSWFLSRAVGERDLFM